ncbi:MAG: ferredoxin--NADP reductase [bacterium]|nr:ferredoxin--NADP reductase [bacterium]
MSYHKLTLARVVDETPEARSFILDVPGELEEGFAYRAGQFLIFRIPWAGGELVRCYSLASCPDTEKIWKVTVKRVEEGRVSNWFHDRLRAGDTLDVLPPAGRFVLRDAAEPLVLFGGGSGITPVISLLKSALATTRRRIRLVYANRSRAGIIFGDELETLARMHAGRFELLHHVDDERGLLGTAQAAAHVRGLPGAHCYLCGPSPFMDVVEGALRQEGFDPDRIFIERFESTETSGMPAEAEDATRTGADATAQQEIVVHLNGKTHRVPCAPDQSILRAVREAGHDPPSACEEGYCGSCAAKRMAGEVRMDVNDVFNQAEVREGWVLTCQGRPVGAGVEVRYDD